MVLYVTARTELTDIVIDYIEVKLAASETVSLNWDESSIERNEDGRFDPSVVISHRFYGLEKISDALEIMTNRDKSVIKPIVFTSEEFK